MRSAPVGQQCVECVAQGAKSIRKVRPLRQARPWVTLSLIAVNVAVYLATAFTADPPGSPGGSPLFRELVLYLPWVAQGELWRTVTTGFLHLGLIHVAVNMISLAIMGPWIERDLGRARFGTIYGTALIGSSAAALWFSPNVLVAGASGAIYGLLGTALILDLRERRNPQNTIIVLLLNIGLSITVPGISLVGHLGGLAFGVLSAIAFLYYREVSKTFSARPRESTPWVLAGAVAALAVLAIVARVVTFLG